MYQISNFEQNKIDALKSILSSQNMMVVSFLTNFQNCHARFSWMKNTLLRITHVKETWEEKKG